LSQHGDGLVYGDNLWKRKENIRRVMMDDGLYEKLGRRGESLLLEYHVKDANIR
jgi:hypothetical protein